jgi:hypothetical protein
VSTGGNRSESLDMMRGSRAIDLEVRCMHLNHLKEDGRVDVVKRKVPTSLGLSIEWDAWQPINISLTRDSKKSKGNLVKTHEM